MAPVETTTRQELIASLDAYLAALAANDPSAINADGAKFTENGQLLSLGKGLWGTATAEPRPERVLAVADPVAGQAACFALVAEAGDPVMLALRLRVEAGRITEAETLVCRDRDTIFSLEGFRRPRPLFDQPVAENERTPREVLANIPHLYLDGILAARGDLIPVAGDTIRIENGVQTVLNPDAVGIRAEARDRGTWHLGVAAQVDLGIFKDIEDARDRRVLVIDEEYGAVFAWFVFDHAGPLTSRGGESRFRKPNAMMVAEVWKVVDSQIRQIEAVLDVFPYGMRPGWD
ncbi:MAG: hypothetical protein J2P58_03610 [Acidimicrobiaceae bacterium]|nr:hypothetical protein [Acidimicrobiaceae bacterium]